MSVSAPEIATRFVFIDTQAFCSRKFDWDGDILSKLRDLGSRRKLEIVTTSVTLRELEAQLEISLTKAQEAIKKSGSIIRQLTDQDLSPLNTEIASQTLKNNLALYFERAKIFTVPTTRNLDSILGDYFDQRPPFSDKKKSEFPDAVVIYSLREWCAASNHGVYVVSADPDMRACCSADGPLFHAETISEFLDKVTVSKQTHDAIFNAVRQSSELKGLIEQAILRSCVITIEPSARDIPEGKVRTARLVEVRNIEIDKVDTYDRVGNSFACHINFWAELRVDAEVESGPSENVRLGFWTKQASGSQLKVLINPDAGGEILVQEFYLGEYDVSFQWLYRLRFA